MASIQEQKMLELESGSSSECAEAAALAGERRTLTSLRAGSVLAAVCLVGLAGYSFSSTSLLKGKTSDAISDLDETWINSHKFQPLGLEGTMKPSLAQKPSESMNDGNKCNDDEEELVGLCYKKCSLLTGGTHPTRTSAFTCCAENDVKKCGLKDQELNLKPCGGVDVAGDINGQESACPHLEGNCFRNEELYLGMCYKKCAELTNNEYTKRISSWSCCKGTTLTDCNPFSGDAVKSDTGYNVGGGATGTGATIHPVDPCLDEANCKQAASSVSAAVTQAQNAATGAVNSATETAQNAYNSAVNTGASLFPSSVSS